MLFDYFTSVRIPLQQESKPLMLNSFFCIVKTIVGMTMCKNMLLVKYVAVGPFHNIRFVADRTFRDLFLSQKLFLGIF